MEHHIGLAGYIEKLVDLAEHVVHLVDLDGDRHGHHVCPGQEEVGRLAVAGHVGCI